MPVQRCTLPLPIPLLPLRAVRPVQSLSACTTVHFTFTYTSTPSTDRTACTEPQCLYNGASLPLPIPLLPLWTVRPVQSLNARTRVHLYLYLFVVSVATTGFGLIDHHQANIYKKI